MASDPLNFNDHNRPFFGFQLVYPVVSRRAGGLSIGINLNPNQACNWACEYCQVPNLTRGKAPPIDLKRLRDELDQMLDAATSPAFMEAYVPEALRVLKDIAFSGNGEPTSSAQFPEAMSMVLDALQRRPALAAVKIVTITNGTYGRSAPVQQALAQSVSHGGEVWFKIDRGASEDIWQVNRVRLNMDQILARLKAVTDHCPVWIQTCMTARQGAEPTPQAVQRYLDFMARIRADQVPLQGILLYTLARPSHQPGGELLQPLPQTWLEALARALRALGWTVRIF